MNSIFKLFLATFFYHHLEFDDGIEAYLKPSPANNKDNVNPINLRYIYDLLFALILKVMIIQLVSGTIIDNFAALRAKEERFNFDKDNICCICGQKRDEIEKIYDKYGKTYKDHIDEDHDPFNYIFYIFYLLKKDKNEYTGMESFIYNMVFKVKDITWFPENK